MAATRRDIMEWYLRGVAEGHPRMIVWCDTFDYEDYPEYTDKTGDALRSYVTYHAGKNMKTLMEVYDLTGNFEDQMAERRAFHY